MEDYKVLDMETRKVDTKKSKDDRKLKLIAAAEQVLNEVAQVDPTIISKANRLSDKVAVVNSLTFGETGGLKEVERYTEKDENGNPIIDPKTGKPKVVRKIEPKPEIVGYAVMNNSDEAIPYETEVYRKVGDKWVGEKTSKILEPGKVAYLTKYYFTKLSTAPEINFLYANGKCTIKYHVDEASNTVDVDKIYATGYFKLSEPGKSVDDDSFAINIGHKVTDKKTGKTIERVKKEFEETFGFLNNEKEPAVRARKVAKEGVDNTRLAIAVYLRKLDEQRARV